MVLAVLTVSTLLGFRGHGPLDLAETKYDMRFLGFFGSLRRLFLMDCLDTNSTPSGTKRYAHQSRYFLLGWLSGTR